NCWIVVHRSAKEGEHPRIEAVRAVVADPVREPRPGDRGREPCGVRDRPHGHVAAVAVAVNADTLWIERRGGERRVDAGQDVAKVPAPEVPDVRPGKRLTLTEAAARVGQQQGVAARWAPRELPERARYPRPPWRGCGRRQTAPPRRPYRRLLRERRPARTRAAAGYARRRLAAPAASRDRRRSQWRETASLSR